MTNYETINFLKTIFPFILNVLNTLVDKDEPLEPLN